MESVLTTNKLDWIVLGNSGGNSNRCVFMVIVVVGINIIIRKSHCWHCNNKVTRTKESPTSACTCHRGIYHWWDAIIF